MKKVSSVKYRGLKCTNLYNTEAKYFLQEENVINITIPLTPSIVLIYTFQSWCSKLTGLSTDPEVINSSLGEMATNQTISSFVSNKL